ncbi:MAG TPA: hypothetical protein VIL36_23795 [Acidimicrobiales bacterium]
MGERLVDPIALVIGLVFVAAGTVVLLGGSLLDEGRFLVPTGLIALGVALLVSGRAGEDGPGDEVGAEGGEDG